MSDFSPFSFFFSLSSVTNVIASPFVPNLPARPTLSSTPSYPMEIGVTVVRHVVVYDNIDSLDVNPSSKYICRYHDAMLEVLESLVMLDAEG